MKTLKRRRKRWKERRAEMKNEETKKKRRRLLRAWRGFVDGVDEEEAEAGAVQSVEAKKMKMMKMPSRRRAGGPGRRAASRFAASAAAQKMKTAGRWSTGFASSRTKRCCCQTTSSPSILPAARGPQRCLPTQRKSPPPAPSRLARPRRLPPCSAVASLHPGPTSDLSVVYQLKSQL
jgi:hypothetical protein